MYKFRVIIMKFFILPEDFRTNILAIKNKLQSITFESNA